MNDATLARINQGEITSRDRDLAESFIAKAAKDSILSLMLQRILASHDRGVGVDVFAYDAEVTPNEAAALLKMSRPHLLTFMDQGDLPFHYVGKTRKHRKIKMGDLKEFMAARAAGQEIVANALHNAPSLPIDEKPLSQDEIEELKNL